MSKDLIKLFGNFFSDTDIDLSLPLVAEPYKELLLALNSDCDENSLRGHINKIMSAFFSKTTADELSIIKKVFSSNYQFDNEAELRVFKNVMFRIVKQGFTPEQMESNDPIYPTAKLVIFIGCLAQALENPKYLEFSNVFQLVLHINMLCFEFDDGLAAAEARAFRYFQGLLGRYHDKERLVLVFENFFKEYTDLQDSLMYQMLSEIIKWTSGKLATSAITIPKLNLVVLRDRAPTCPIPPSPAQPKNIAFSPGIRSFVEQSLRFSFRSEASVVNSEAVSPINPKTKKVKIYNTTFNGRVYSFIKYHDDKNKKSQVGNANTFAYPNLYKAFNWKYPIIVTVKELLLTLDKDKRSKLLPEIMDRLYENDCFDTEDMVFKDKRSKFDLPLDLAFDTDGSEDNKRLSISKEQQNDLHREYQEIITNLGKRKKDWLGWSHYLETTRTLTPAEQKFKEFCTRDDVYEVFCIKYCNNGLGLVSAIFMAELNKIDLCIWILNPEGQLVVAKDVRATPRESPAKYNLIYDGGVAFTLLLPHQSPQPEPTQTESRSYRP